MLVIYNRYYTNNRLIHLINAGGRQDKTTPHAVLLPSSLYLNLQSQAERLNLLSASSSLISNSGRRAL